MGGGAARGSRPGVHLRLIEVMMGPATRVCARRLTADLTVSVAEAVSVWDRRRDMLQAPSIRAKAVI
jgi:hypothetical protein